jgi:hypothetical protein
MKKLIRFPMYLLITCSMLLIGGLACAEAAPISYSFSGTGFGALTPGVPEFNNAAFAINLFGDTDGVIPDPDQINYPGQLINPVTGTVAVAGVLLETALAGPLSIYSDPNAGFVGIIGPDGFSFLDWYSDMFFGYDLRSILGPTRSIPIGGGDILLADAAGTILAFDTIDGAVFNAPEPTSIALLGFGLLGLVSLKLRGRKS